MKIVVLNGSPRKDGNTDLLAREFAKGASKHNEVEIVPIRNLHVNPCVGCNACFKNGEHICCQKDDMKSIIGKLSQADMLVIATPVYFYGVSAQLKAVIDRLHNPIRDTFSIQRIALMAVGAASLPELFDAILAEYRLCANFFKLEDMGTILVRGVKEKGDILNTGALQEAYDYGAKLC